MTGDVIRLRRVPRIVVEGTHRFLAAALDTFDADPDAFTMAELDRRIAELERVAIYGNGPRIWEPEPEDGY